jgi:single-strand DNA-binding protein
MASGYSKLIIVGNLGGDPEMRYTPSGQAVTNFSLAVNRSWTDNNGEVHEETTWYRVSAWGRQAETCNQYLSKGRQVLVEGRLVVDPETGGPRIWMDQNGKARASFEINAYEVRFLGGNGNGNGRGELTPDEIAEYQQELSEDQIPF